MTNDNITLPRPIVELAERALSWSRPMSHAADGSEGRHDAALNELRAALAQPMTDGEYKAVGEQIRAQPAQEPLFLLHTGQIDSGGEQDEWETEADSYKRVEEFCRQHPSKTIGLFPAPAAQPAQEQVDLYGVKAGVQVPLGKAPMPPSMKARQLAREQFGHFEDDDGSDAELCFGALEQMIEWMYSRGFRIATLAQPAQEDAECDHGECFGGKCIYKQPALTDDEIEAVYLSYLASKGSQPMWSFARAVIAAHIKKQGGKP